MSKASVAIQTIALSPAARLSFCDTKVIHSFIHESTVSLTFFINTAPAAAARNSVRGFALTSVPLLRKYIGVFDVFITPALEGQLISVDTVEYAYKGTSKHPSACMQLS